MRRLFSTHRIPERGEVVDFDGWKIGRHGMLTWAEGHPSTDGLALPADVIDSAVALESFLDSNFGLLQDHGVARLDVTTTQPFHREPEARAFLSGMAALDLPRCHTIRRGRPVQSIGWVNERGRKLLARCYDKGLEQGGEPFRSVRLEDQGRFKRGRRPPLEVAADPDYQRERFERRFRPMAQAVEGVKAMTVPVLLQSIADEARYGYRSMSEARKLAGSVVLFSGGVKPSRGDATLYRWRRELRDAGYVAVDDLTEAVEVDLGDVLDQALGEFGA